MLFRKLWLSLCAGALLAAHPLQAEEPTQLREVRVAYIGILPSETTEHAVYPTFDFLKSQLGHKYRFKLFDISNHDFLEEINVLKPHLLFAPSEIYLQLAAIPQLNAHDIAALKSVFSSKTSASVGSVFITRADRNDINTIADMKGKRVAAANNENLSEWWAALGELKEHGYAPNRFFGSERFTRERHLGAVEEVLAGSSDVGILPTCLLEAYEGVGFVAPGSLKVIEPYDNAKDESPFYCRRSTRALYPGIVISSLANAPDDIVKDVVRTLFTMSPFQGNEWAAGYDYTEVLRLMKDLKFGMYENLRDYSLGALLQRYKTAPRRTAELCSRLETATERQNGRRPINQDRRREYGCGNQTHFPYRGFGAQICKKRAACTYRIRFSSNRRKGDPHFPSAGRGKNSSSLPNGCGHSAGFSRSSFLGTFNFEFNPKCRSCQ